MFFFSINLFGWCLWLSDWTLYSLYIGNNAVTGLLVLYTLHNLFVHVYVCVYIYRLFQYILGNVDLKTSFIWQCFILGASDLVVNDIKTFHVDLCALVSVFSLRRVAAEQSKLTSTFLLVIFKKVTTIGNRTLSMPYVRRRWTRTQMNSTLKWYTLNCRYVFIPLVSIGLGITFLNLF